MNVPFHLSGEPLLAQGTNLVERLLVRAWSEEVDDLVVEPTDEGYRILHSHADALTAIEVQRGPHTDYERIRNELKAAGNLAEAVCDVRQRGSFPLLLGASRVGDVQMMLDPGSKGAWIRLSFNWADSKKPAFAGQA